MPPKGRGGGSAPKKRNHSLDNTLGRMSTAAAQGLRGIGNPLAVNMGQSKFSIAPLILEGVNLNKLQLNDLLKQDMSDIKLNDIQLSRSGAFTLYAADVKSFNRLLNDLSAILSTKGQKTAKMYVPRSIQRIKDTEQVAFVKRVDLEISNDLITDSLKNAGLDVTNVTRLTSKDGNTPTRTLKITFSDVANRNTFVYTGLQVDSMHFNAEPATQNTKPVQCYICLKYNHVAKYCKTKQQICARCGENHRLDQCNAANDAPKCCNCKGNHLATSSDCSTYKDQSKRMQSLINQYSSANKPATPAPALQNNSEFPPLHNVNQHTQGNIQKHILDEILNVLSSRMEKIIEETTSKLFRALQEKIEKLEKTIETLGNLSEDVTSATDSDSEEESQVTKYINNKKKQNAEAEQLLKTTSIPQGNTAKITIKANDNATTAKPTQKEKTTTKKAKRPRSPNSSLDSSALDNNKDLKTSNKND